MAADAFLAVDPDNPQFPDLYAENLGAKIVQVGGFPTPEVVKEQIDARIAELDIPEVTDAAVAGFLADPDSATAAQLSATIDAAIIESGAGASGGFLVTQDPDGCLVLVYQPTPPADVPGAPTELVVSGGGDGQVVLSWMASSAPEGAPVTDYSIQYRILGASAWSTFAHAASTATSITITGLTNGVSMEARVAGVNVGGMGAYSDPVSFTTGSIDGVVLDDLFGRTGASLAGTMPDVGSNSWAAINTGGQTAFSLNGARAVSSGNGGLVSLDSGARGIDSWGLTAVVQFASNETASKALRLYSHWIDSSHYLYVSLNASTSQTASISIIGAFGGSSVTLTNQFPNGTIPSNAVGDYSVSAVLSGTSYVVRINGAERTYTLTSEQVGAIDDATKIALYSNSTQHQIDRITLTVDGTYVS